MHRPATFLLRVSPFARPGWSKAVLRRAAAGLAAGGAAAALSACSTQSPAQTQVPYQPGDGVSANIGSVEARGLVVVAQSQNTPGVLVGSVINTASDPVTITFLTAAQAQGGTTSGPQMQLKGGQQETITGVQFPSTPAPPGALTNIVLQTPAGQTSVDVPVLPPDGYYSSATPTSAPTTTATTGASTSSPTGTAATGTAATGTSTTAPATPTSTATTSGG